MGLFGFGKKDNEETVVEDPITFDEPESTNKVSCCFYHGAFYDEKLLAGTKTTISYDESLAIEDVQALLSENNSDDVIAQYDEYTNKELSKIIGDNVKKLNIRRANELEFKNRFDCEYKAKAEDKFGDGLSEFVTADEGFIKSLFVDVSEDEETSERKAIKIANNSEASSTAKNDETEADENDNEELVGQVSDELESGNPSEDKSTDNMTIDEEIEECGVTCDAMNDPDSVAAEFKDNSVDNIVKAHDFDIGPIDCEYNKIPTLEGLDEVQVKKEEVSNMPNDFVDTNEKYKNLLERTDLCEDSKNVLDVIPDVVSLQNEKAKLYGRSWCKHGEISAFFNIERKWDRFQNIMEKCLNEGIDNVIYGDEDGTDTFIDTVLDLTAYSSMLLGYIKEKHPDEYNKFFSK